MSDDYERSTRDVEIDNFTSGKDYVTYNIGHLVLDDHNVDDDAIRSTLEYIKDRRNGYLLDNLGEVSDKDIDDVVLFLEHLLTIEDVVLNDTD